MLVPGAELAAGMTSGTDPPMQAMQLWTRSIARKLSGLFGEARGVLREWQRSRADMDGTQAAREAEIAALLAALGPVADRLGSRAAVAQFEADIDDPARTRRGTALEGTTGPLPRFLPCRDLVRISFNLIDMLPAAAILERMAKSPRLPTEDNLTFTLPYAPTLGAALGLGTRYASAMLPWFQVTVDEDGDRMRILVAPVAPLGRIEALSTELALATACRVVETFVGTAIAGARIDLAPGLALDAAAAAGRFPCPVHVGEGISALSFPRDWRDRPSPYHDLRLWLDGVERCEADLRALDDPPITRRVRTFVVARLREGRAVTTRETASALGMCLRSLVRSLERTGTTHHGILEQERRALALRLLADDTVPIAQVAERLDFPDRSSFGRKCRAWFTQSPARLRRELLGTTLLR